MITVQMDRDIFKSKKQKPFIITFERIGKVYSRGRKYKNRKINIQLE